MKDHPSSRKPEKNPACFVSDSVQTGSYPADQAGKKPSSSPAGFEDSSWLWLAGCILVCAGIFYFSSRSGIDSQSQSDTLLDLLDLPLTPQFSRLIRKSAHFLIYALLGGLWFGFFRSVHLKSGKAFLLALACSALYAAGDEFHQHFIAGRSGQFADVLLDSCGAACGSGVFLLFHRLKENRSCKGNAIKKKSRKKQSEIERQNHSEQKDKETL